jgi:D-3-phosphoglycerate dehydrogenase
MENIFVALSTFAEFDSKPVNMLRCSGIPFNIHGSGKRITREELLANAKDASVIIAGVEPYTAEVLSGLPNLKCIVRLGVGVDAIDLNAAKERNITILNTPDIPTTAVAELAISLIFALSRNLRAQSNSMGNRKWERLESHLVSGKTIGIFGFGRIGRKVAEFCKPFGVTILVCDPFLSKEETLLHSDIIFTDKIVLLENADIISIHASKSETPVIDLYDYLEMKPGVILINLSRGGMIDEEGLVLALQMGQVAAAGLDVFEKEPYDGPLSDFENVILTPHSATLPVESRVAMEIECVDKGLRFIKGMIEANEKVV